MEFTRKDMLKMGVLGSAALALPLMRPAQTRRSIDDLLPDSRTPRPFEATFRRPERLAPRYVDTRNKVAKYTVRMQQRPAEIVPGLRTDIWGYNGLTPGPTIEVMKGWKTVIRQLNYLPKQHPLLGAGSTSKTSVHLHGSASRPQYDGFAEDTTEPGEGKDYHYPNFQPARTLWYHDHAVHHTDENAYMGLAGMYILHDKEELALPIPHGRYDVPLILKDVLIAKDGSLIFDDRGHTSLMGNMILVNGRPWPRMRVERRKYRFRILNASVSRSYDLSLSTGEPLHVIGHDGGLAPRPVAVDHIRVGMAERYEIVIDFAKYRPGQKVVLRNRELPNNVDWDHTNVVMRFDVEDEPRDPRNNRVPPVLAPATNSIHNPMRLTEAQSVHTERLELDRGNGMWRINDRIWDKDRVDVKCDHEAVEVWELVNKSGGWFHPLHIHLVDFKILDRNGQAPFPWERGPKDTAYIGENETVRVLAKFGPHKGRYMVHCHNLAHEDHDMMLQFEVGSGGDPWNSDSAKPIRDLKPLSRVRFRG